MKIQRMRKNYNALPKTREIVLVDGNQRDESSNAGPTQATGKVAVRDLASEIREQCNVRRHPSDQKPRVCVIVDIERLVLEHGRIRLVFRALEINALHDACRFAQIQNKNRKVSNARNEGR